jgi:vacuole morphology and inheritance protein 14
MSGCLAVWLSVQVARDGFIIFFSEVFDAMFRLCADSESNVQNAVQFLDNLVKVGGPRGSQGHRHCQP